MKAEKIVLTALCAGVCLWTAKMVVGVIGLARHQGPHALLALFEVATFLGAGLIPLLMVWLRSARTKKWLLGVWILCIAYVSILALNYCRFDVVSGVIRLLLWIAIIVMFTRTLKEPKPA